VVSDEAVKDEIAQKSKKDPYVDPFGYDATEENPDRRYQ
jgi:hypothetical protein